ncbi:Rv2175c family DNA-binding protein [Janibacter sp. G1551]|uniref:Rv2175c family DNA-binding protein n=1 Tax=Janibacter sp. G1551 TaxID=3420440 RepID=UPI003D0352AD
MNTPDETPATDAATDEVSLESLVGDWLTVPDLAERLDLPLSIVRRLIDDREVLAHRIGERKVVAVPAAFLDEEGIIPSLAGTFTVLADGRMNDEEILRWLFTPDDTFPGGSAIGAVHAGFKTEVRRRAMEEAL